MRSIHSILVAVKDPKARSQPAAIKAARLAHALGARLELFHALSEPVYGETDTAWRKVRKEMHADACKRLRSLADRLPRGARIEVAAEWDFPAYEAVVRRARRIKADLVVAERHAGRHFAPWLLHLNDWELLRLSPIPVLLVKRAGTYEHPVVLAAVDPSRSEKPAKLDDVILSIGAAIAGALRGALHVVHAHPSVSGGTRATDAFSPNKASRINAEFVATAKSRLDRALRSTAIARNRRHLSALPPVEAIQAVARLVRSDLVVMGAISRSGFKRVFIGNTAESLLDALRCDLLIVKPPGFLNRVPAARRGARFIAWMPMFL